jgi:uncharacterized membrane protein
VVPVAAAVLAAMAYLAARRADALITPAYDRAIFTQLAWNLGRGAGFTSTLERVNYLGIHISPLLLAVAPLTWIWPGPAALDFVNAFALSASGPAAYLFIRRLLAGFQMRELTAAALAAPVPVWAAVQWADLSGFHPEALALPLALVAAWAGISGRRRTLWTCALLALCAKEDQVYTVGLIGLLTWVKGPESVRRDGKALIAVGFVWAVAAFLVVMPLIRQGAHVSPVGYYMWLWHPEPAQVLAALTHPAAWLAGLALLLGMAGLPLLQPRWLLLALPPFVADMLSSHYPQYELKLHYGLLVMLPVVVAGALGARWLLERRRLPALAAAGLALPAVVAGYFFGTLTPNEFEWTTAVGHPVALHRLQTQLGVIPSGAPVSADDGLAAEVAGRPVLHVLPDAPASDYLLIDREAVLHSYIDTDLREFQIAQLGASGRTLLRDDGRFQVWSPVGS